MIYLVTAHHKEAAPFISLFGMKKQIHQSTRFELFSNGEHVLIVSGTGTARTAAATAYLLTLYTPSQNDVLVNLGVIEEGADGDVFLCSVIDGGTGGRNYPHILKKHPFKEAAVTDADGACIFQAAGLFLPPERIAVIRAVREIGKNADIIKEWITGFGDGTHGNLPFFSHIYVEKEAFGYDVTDNILARFSDSAVIPVGHYKDVFSPKNQNFALQKNSRKLILAVKTGARLYKGSGMCDSFGHENFFYTADMLNCVYDCSYCYLQGMYPSANITLFVNIDDTLSEVAERLKYEPLYICVSYNTDLLALESLTGYAAKWVAFAEKHENLSLEIRTKSAGIKELLSFPVIDNVFFAWTISPQEIVSQFEHGTPPPKARLDAVRQAVLRGFKVRICVDPIICGYDEAYRQLYEIIKNDEILRGVPLSIGIFRVPQNYFKKMKKQNKGNSIYKYPFINENGCISYKPDDMERVLGMFAGLPEGDVNIWEKR